MGFSLAGKSKKRGEKKTSSVVRVSENFQMKPVHLLSTLLSLYVYSTPVPATAASGQMTADQGE